METTASFTSIPRAWPPLPEDVLDVAKARTLAALSDEGARPVSERLADYYDVHGNYVGASFTELHPNDWHDVTAADLHAVSLMNVKIGPRATRRLLAGPERTWVVESLRQLPDRELFLAGPAELEAMYIFYDALKNALADPEARRSNRWVTASKLAARKRPDLFPVRDRVVCDYLGVLSLSDVRHDWQTYRALIQDERIRQRLFRLPDAVAAVNDGRTVVLETSELRLLDAALWTYARNGAPEQEPATEDE